ncbi:MAG: YlmC/YmxH family sporulation protein [Bacilli bacterium]|mgnify:CR=1 FL=1|jgi:YlmC/YmxH family sporulation protein|nr:YlmC/YmxH family sporulation protein [Bacilli bacterium]HHU23974.1 YlmC/YmxH family sporulation protein [Acholeplasmataceae bacterium]
MLLSELADKDVINEKDGSKIGKITDVEIDTNTGNITSIKVQAGMKIMQLVTRKDATRIPWQNIIKIGNDVIIVDYSYHGKTLKQSSN